MEIQAKLTIQLLRSPVIHHNGQVVSDFRSQKALGLLAYLAYTGTTHRREALADLLWDSRTTKQALSNLRTVLTQLRKELADYLVVSNRSLAFDQEADYWLDTTALQHVLTTPLDSPENAKQVEAGLQLYCGEFLEGLSFPDAPRFNEWAMLERERLHLSVIEQYRELATYYLEQADYKQGITISDSWLALDMLDETAHRYRMQVLALDGQRTRAIAQYEQCAHILKEELGIEPAPATTALYNDLKNSSQASQSALSNAPVLTPSPSTIRITKSDTTPTPSASSSEQSQRSQLGFARSGQLMLGTVLVLFVIGIAFILLRDAPATVTIVDDNDTSSSTVERICFSAEAPSILPDTFNGDIWIDVQEAAEKFNAEAVVQHNYLGVDTHEEYEEAFVENLNELLDMDCDLIVTVGFNHIALVAGFARANPDANVIMLDSDFDPPINNIWAQDYAPDEAAFLAGYVAAHFTRTGKVGTYGGFQIPPVESFMDGFARGVAHYNTQKGTKVEVLGWDIESRTGLFVNSFSDNVAGRQATRQLIEDGVDIILPVAGHTGFASAQIALTEEGVYIIGVDNDWAVTHPQYAPVVLTSIEKRWNLSIISVLSALEQGTFTGGTHIGTLENGEVGLSPFHTFDSRISEELVRELIQVEADIITGRVQTRPTEDQSQP